MILTQMKERPKLVLHQQPQKIKMIKNKLKRLLVPAPIKDMPPKPNKEVKGLKTMKWKYLLLNGPIK